MRTQSEKTVRIIKRKHGEGTITVTKKNGNLHYKYDYPFCREIKKQIIIGDIIFIAKHFDLAQSYVSNVLRGIRYHEGIIDFALKIIESRKKLLAEA